MGARAERLHVARPRRLPHHLPRRGRRRGDRPADRLRRAPEDRRRGARPRARRRDPGDRPRARPAVGDRRAPDRPRGVRRPSAGPARARAGGAPARRSRATRILAFRRRQWVGRARRRVPGRQPRAPARELARWPSCSAASRRSRPTARYEPAPAVRADDAGRGARVHAVAPADVLPARDRRRARRAERAALAVYSTLLGGSMGSRLFDEIREQRGLAYSRLRDRPLVRRRADPAALGRPGLDKCVEAYTRMREIVDELRTDGPTRGGGRARPRVRRRPARAGVREHERRRPPRGARRPSSSARTSTPTRRSRRSTR